MSHLVLQASSEFNEFLVVIPWDAALESKVRGRMDLAAAMKAKDDRLYSMTFGFYGFDVYEDVSEGVLNTLFGEDRDFVDVAIVDEVPDLGTPERIDYGALIVDEVSMRLQFGIKHVSQPFDTAAVYRDSDVFQKNDG